MVDINPIKEVGSQLLAKILTSILWIGLAILVIGIVGFVMWFFLVYRKKFDITAIVYSERADGKKRIIFDKAAILTDRKSKTDYLKLWGLKVSLPTPHYGLLQQTNRGDTIELLRRSENDFLYLMPPKINMKEVVRNDGKKYPIAWREHGLLDPEIAYWNVKRKNLNADMFAPESILMRVLPYIPQIMGGVITIFILYVLMKYLPSVLSQLQGVVKELQTYKGAEVVTYKQWMTLISYFI